MKKIIFISLLALFSISISAQATCTLKHQIIKEIYSPLKESFRCDFVQSLDDDFKNINQIFNKHYQKPLYVVLFPTGNNASFDLGHFLELPERMVYYDRFGNQLNSSIMGLSSIAHHEYGHFLFQELLREKFGSLFESLFQTFDNYSNKKREIFAQKKSGFSKKESNEYIEALKNEPEIARFNKVISIYTELYADIISVYYSSNKNAIFESLYYDKMSDFEYSLVQLRSFDLKVENIDISKMGTEHNYLSITRAFIGKNLWPTNDLQKSIFLEKIESAFIKSIEIDLQRGEVLSVKEANEQLIGLLKEEIVL